MPKKSKKDDFIADDDEVDDEPYSDGEEEDLDAGSKARSAKGKGSKREAATKKESKKSSKKAKLEKSDDEEQDDAPPAKSRANANKPGIHLTRDDEGNSFGDLGGDRRVTVSEFKGKTYIAIREYYSDKNSDAMKPGKKGISLNLENWEALKEYISLVDGAVADMTASKKGGSNGAAKKKAPKSPKYVEESD